MIDAEGCLLVFFLLALLEAALLSFRLSFFSSVSSFLSSFVSSFPSSFFSFFSSFSSCSASCASSSQSPSDVCPRFEHTLPPSEEDPSPRSLRFPSLSLPAGEGEREAYLRLRRNYLLVYLLAQASEWIQGPYMFAFYASSCSLSLNQIGWLFLTEYASTGIFGCLVGCLADLSGHRQACLAYCLLCLLSCSLTRAFPSSFALLLLGRLLGGIALSVLETAFEAWLVSAHLRRCFPLAWLEETLGACTLFNGVLAIFVGFLASAVCKSFGLKACFDLASAFAVLAACSILALPSHAPGGTNASKRRARHRDDMDEPAAGTAEEGEGGEHEEKEDREKGSEEHGGRGAQGRVNTWTEEERTVREREEEGGREGRRDSGRKPVPGEDEIRHKEPGDGAPEVSAGARRSSFSSVCMLGDCHPQENRQPLAPALGECGQGRAWEEAGGEPETEERHWGEIWRGVAGHLRAATEVILNNKAVQACGAIQIFFEVPMYIFFVTWTPALDPRIDHGLVFACFMVCLVLGSELFLQSCLRGRDPRLALRDALSLGALALAVPAFTTSHSLRFAAFSVFEVACGVYYPCIATVRAKVIENGTRAAVVNLFRLPLNAAILLLGGWGLTEANLGPLFAFSAALVAAAAGFCAHLIKAENEPAASSGCAVDTGQSKASVES
ncbi:hypothetical protein NCLIV_010400 [Neospora caninum Liverpool]|uniref:Molybdate-anion transporter n=1 Tax=Neospora caninum (strain Liverpool) TaxID=572307 RepID=F0VA82_NEOCL|nr:hypothetical protein NCLIV_010400 [Neospora caninum Liverpool]CBZ50571.1 hypothetical protein NCLIV_010400 [Neospora caninum Liverpool]CEL65183.1 TPA: transporter, major facilitator family protein [Neospora caninum Liverpool]|eukprot:XP_003880604.1 hypothetical protein NCLIV_010400 [Neospora caninum Liverpool]